eukprot:230928-Pleurochrysis_carterae.AAC.1
MARAEHDLWQHTASKCSGATPKAKLKILIVGSLSHAACSGAMAYEKLEHYCGATRPSNVYRLPR